MSFGQKSNYRDAKFQGKRHELERKLAESCTLYVGNLSFYTTEEQIYALFSMAGIVKRIILGLDKIKRTPCGFAFVEYYNREDAEMAHRYVSGTKLDDRIIRTDFDAGFEEGRQYGRGRSGGQVRDEYRQGFDADRGGFGIHLQQGAMGPHPGMAPPGMAPPGMAPPGMAPSSEF